MTISPEQARHIYRTRFSAADNTAKARVWKVLVARFFQRWVRATDVVLDLGCGYGEFLNHVRCARRIGVDLNPDSAGRLVHAEFHQHTVCDLPFLADESVDFVFTSNLMEHLPDKPAVEAMLSETWRVLRPGGHCVLMGPNVRVLPGRYWHFWDHLVPISDQSLREALESIGFEVIDCRARFLPYTTQSALPQWPGLVALYLKVPVMWRLLGSQFLVRARKRAHPDATP